MCAAITVDYCSTVEAGPGVDDPGSTLILAAGSARFGSGPDLVFTVTIRQRPHRLVLGPLGVTVRETDAGVDLLSRERRAILDAVRAKADALVSGSEDV